MGSALCMTMTAKIIASANYRSVPSYIVDSYIILFTSASRLNVLWSVRVNDSVGGPPAAISALQLLPDIQRVALALETGR